MTDNDDVKSTEEKQSRPIRRRTFNVVAAQVSPSAVPAEPVADASLSTMAFQAIHAFEDRTNLWVPIHHDDDQFIFVTPEENEVGGIRDGTQTKRAIIGLAAGLEAARVYLDEGKKVQIRLLPGVYREKVSLPSNVALVNHHIPRNLSTDEQRFWLIDDENDHEQHVVLALPEDAGVEDFVITCEDSTDVIFALLGCGSLEEVDKATLDTLLVDERHRGNFYRPGIY